MWILSSQGMEPSLNTDAPEEEHRRKLHRKKKTGKMKDYNIFMAMVEKRGMINGGMLF